MSIEVVEGSEAQLDCEIEIAELLLKASRLVDFASIKEREALAMRNQAETYLFRVAELRRQIGAYTQRGDA